MDRFSHDRRWDEKNYKGHTNNVGDQQAYLCRPFFYVRAGLLLGLYPTHDLQMVDRGLGKFWEAIYMEVPRASRYYKNQLKPKNDHSNDGLHETVKI